jgi:hypothetical protein
MRHVLLRFVPLALVAVTANVPAVAATGIRFAADASFQDPVPPPPPPAPAAGGAARPEERLQKQLREGAAVVDRSFELTWSWSEGRRTVMQHRAKTPIRPIRPAAASGSLHADLLCLRVPAPDEIELLQLGTQAIARQAGAAWKQVERLQLEQNGARFTPDPRLLLGTLAAVPFVVRDRKIDEVGGQPVEVVALELPPESGELLHRAGAIPDPNPVDAGMRATMERHRVDPAHVPPPVLDVAITIDVTSQQVVGVTVRALLAPVDSRAILQAAGGRMRATADDAAAIAAVLTALRGDGKQPFVYRDGLPERDAAGAEQRLLTCRIGGPAERPKLGEEQERLLQPR